MAVKPGRDPIVEEMIERLQIRGVHAERLRQNLAAAQAPSIFDEARVLERTEASVESLVRATRGPRPDAPFGVEEYGDPEPEMPPPPAAAAAEPVPEETAQPRRRRRAPPGETSAGSKDPELDAIDAAPTAADDKRVYTPAPTMLRFHESNKKVRAILGPVGSGKSSTCCLEILSRAMRVPPLGEGRVRHSRWLVARSTYAELKSTTIRTFKYWLGHLGRFRFGSPITYEAKQSLPDGTTMHLEVEFMPLDGEDAVKRLRSLELTGCWLNEASLIEANHIVEIIGRLRFRGNDYPRDRQPWRGIIIDSNMPTTRHWLYEAFEKDPPDNHELFLQPPALLRRPDGKYDPNPEAENIEHLPGGYEYYFDMVTSNDERVRRKINVLVLSEYGAIFDGRPVYESSWARRAHVSDGPIQVARHLPLVIGLDWGMNPAAVYTQAGAMGGLNVLDEDCPPDLTLDEFLSQFVLPKIARRFPGMTVQVVGDPAGINRSSLAQKTAFQVVRMAGLPIVPAFTNDIQTRRDAVSHYLTRMGRFLIDKNTCPVLIEGFEGGYRFKKRPGSEGYAEEPQKNHPHSDVHDALQYAAMMHYRPHAEAMARGSRVVPAPQAHMVTEGGISDMVAGARRRRYYYG